MRYTQGQGLSEGIPLTPSKRMLKKSFWSPEEDEKLVNYIRNNGNLGSWSYVAKQTGLHRSGKSCRLRWINYLCPGLKRGPFSYEEERLIIRLQSILGNRWSLIAAQLPGRTDNELKNYWKTCIKKKLNMEHHLSCSSSSFSSKSNVTDTISHIRTQSNSNSVSDDAHHVITSSQSFQQCMDVLPEGSQPPNNAFNVVNSGENLWCVPGVMDSRHIQLEDQIDHEFSVDPNPTNNQEICYANLWSNASSLHIQEGFSSPAAFISPSLHTKWSTSDQLILDSCSNTTLRHHKAHCFPDIYLGSTGINIPALIESDSSKGKLENDENHIMIDYSNATDSSDIVDPGRAYTSHEGEVSILDKYGSLYQLYSALNPHYQFSWPAGEFSEIPCEKDCRDSLNFSYECRGGAGQVTTRAQDDVNPPVHSDVDEMDFT